MNSVHLIGRLATDVDVKEVNGGSKVSSFILAVDRSADEADFALPHTKVRALLGLAGRYEYNHQAD
jgi:single-stranded DNA-binding protein